MGWSGEKGGEGGKLCTSKVILSNKKSFTTETIIKTTNKQ
jgi:hypothetical protein